MAAPGSGLNVEESASRSAHAPGVPRERDAAAPCLLVRFARFVTLPHTLFALPFAGVGAVLGIAEQPEAATPSTLLWLLVAFTAARFVAMGFNRIVDRRFDAVNPRTSQRELPAGRLTLRQAWAAVTLMAALFVFAAWMLNPLCGWLAPVALSWICFYSYTKRFTSWSHYVLGLALGIAPVGAFLAIVGEWSQPWFALPLLATGVCFWVAGFDVIYALQDIQFDRAHGLHSLPARLGEERALRWAGIMHVLSMTVFLGLWLLRAFPLGYIYLVGLFVMALLLAYQHVTVRTREDGRLDRKRIERAFFPVNAGVSAGFFLFTVLDRTLLP